MTEQTPKRIPARIDDNKAPQKMSSLLGDRMKFDVSVELTNSFARTTLRRVEPNRNLSEKAAQRLARIVVGQEEACQIVGRRYVLACLGAGGEHKPLSAIYELGETGVGKTEMAHALSELVFGDPYSDRLKILNGGEYMEPHDVKKIIGSPPSYVGYNEEGAIPHDWLHEVDEERGELMRSIIVVDEIDKAHPAVERVLLSILDKGKINARDRHAGIKPLDFSNTFLIFTSNVGADDIVRAKNGQLQVGFDVNSQGGALAAQDAGLRALRKRYQHMPEFLGRLTDVVVFNSLEEHHYEEIFSKILEQRNKNLIKRYGAFPRLAATIEFREYVLSLMDGKSGARELNNLLDREMLDKAVNVLPEIPEDSTLVVGYERGQVVFFVDTYCEGEVLDESEMWDKESSYSYDDDDDLKL